MRDSVFIVAEGKQHLAIAEVLSATLAEAGIPVSLLHPHVLDDRNVAPWYRWAISDIYAVPGSLQYAGLVLFLTHESSPYCMFSNKVGVAARWTHTPCLTVQHGWIQPGLNFFGDCKRVGYVGRGTDNGPAITHFSDVLRYDTEAGIGCPLLPAGFGERVRLPSRLDARVLLATNFNWGVFRRESIVGFLRAVAALKQEFPDLTFMHRPHAAEKNQGLAAELGVYMDALGAVPAPGELQEALAAADLVITTPSTIALDALAAGVPAFVYQPEEFAGVAHMIGGAGFRSAADLPELLRRLFADGAYVAPPVPAYRPAMLVENVARAMADVGPYAMDDETYLRFVQMVK